MAFIVIPLTKTQLFNVSSIADGNLVYLAVDLDGWNPDDMTNGCHRQHGFSALCFQVSGLDRRLLVDSTLDKVVPLDDLGFYATVDYKWTGWTGYQTTDGSIGMHLNPVKLGNVDSSWHRY
jgi:hypothetical protein